MKKLQVTMKNRMAVGTDRINTELLKYAGEVLNNRLSDFINVCWRCAEFSKTCYQAHVISIIKE